MREPFTNTKAELPPRERKELLGALKARFDKNMNRHKSVAWAKVQEKLEANPEKLWSLNEMERTGGEPDVVGHDRAAGEYIFMIVQHKVPQVGEMFVTTLKRWRREKNINQKIVPSIWRPAWAFSF